MSRKRFAGIKILTITNLSRHGIAKDLRENSPFCMAKLLKLEMFS